MSEQTDLLPMHSAAEDESNGLPGFTVVRRGGYDVSQVDGHVAWLEDQLREAEEARELAERRSEEARRDAQQAREELESGRPDWDAFGERIGTILRLAEEEGASVRQQRLAEADALLTDARRAHAEADQQHANRLREAETEGQEMMRNAQAEASQIVRNAQAEAEEHQRIAGRRLAELERQRDAVHTQLARLHEGLAAALQVQLPPDQRGAAGSDAADAELSAESR